MKWQRTHSCNHWHVLSKASLLLENWTEHKLQLVWQHAHQKCLFIFTHWSCNIKASWPLSEMTPHQNSSQLQSTSHAMAKLRDAESCCSKGHDGQPSAASIGLSTREWTLEMNELFACMRWMCLPEDFPTLGGSWRCGWCELFGHRYIPGSLLTSKEHLVANIYFSLLLWSTTENGLLPSSPYLL